MTSGVGVGGEDVIIVRDGEVIIDLIVIVMDVAAIHAGVGVIGTERDGAVEVGEGRGIVFLAM